jgi:hypothetical protein
MRLLDVLNASIVSHRPVVINLHFELAEKQSKSEVGVRLV